MICSSICATCPSNTKCSIGPRFSDDRLTQKWAIVRKGRDCDRTFFLLLRTYRRNSPCLVAGCLCDYIRPACGSNNFSCYTTRQRPRKGSMRLFAACVRRYCSLTCSQVDTDPTKRSIYHPFGNGLLICQRRSPVARQGSCWIRSEGTLSFL